MHWKKFPIPPNLTVHNAGYRDFAGLRASAFRQTFRPAFPCLAV